MINIMIRVLRHGLQPKWFGKCSDCGCEIECDEKDVSPVGSITCPDCGYVIYVSPINDKILANRKKYFNNPYLYEKISFPKPEVLCLTHHYSLLGQPQKNLSVWL